MDDGENLAALRARRNLIKMGSVGAASAAVLLLSLKSKPAKAALPCAAAIGCRCFLKGTNVRTADGYRKIEELKVGDLLPTVFRVLTAQRASRAGRPDRPDGSGRRSPEPAIHMTS